MVDFFYNSWHNSLEQAKILLHQGIFTPEVGKQALIVMGAMLLAFILARIMISVSLPRLRQHWGEDSLWFTLADKCAGYILPLFTAIALEIAVLAFCEEFPHCHLIVISAKLAWAWLLVRLFTSFVVKGTPSRILVLIIYFILALEIIGPVSSLDQLFRPLRYSIGQFPLVALEPCQGRHSGRLSAVVHQFSL